MNVVEILLPALFWGVLPLVVAKTGGRPVHQIFGTAFGTLIIGIILWFMISPSIDLTNALLAGLAGAFWIIGQLGQYTGYEKIGVSKTMPISTGLQLIGTSLIGVVIFGEWAGTAAKITGFLGVLLLVIGVATTSIKDKTTSVKTAEQSQTGTIVMLVFTTLGYLVYNSIPKALSASGLAIFLPESVGMVVAVLIYLIFTRQLNVFTQRASWVNLNGGFVFSFAGIAYIISVSANGVNLAFVISQLSVVISTIGGMLFLHEHKTQRELLYTVIGLVLIVAGAFITTLS